MNNETHGVGDDTGEARGRLIRNVAAGVAAAVVVAATITFVATNHSSKPAVTVGTTPNRGTQATTPSTMTPTTMRRLVTTTTVRSVTTTTVSAQPPVDNVLTRDDELFTANGNQLDVRRAEGSVSKHLVTVSAAHEIFEPTFVDANTVDFLEMKLHGGLGWQCGDVVRYDLVQHQRTVLAQASSFSWIDADTLALGGIERDGVRCIAGSDDFAHETPITIRNLKTGAQLQGSLEANASLWHGIKFVRTLNEAGGQSVVGMLCLQTCTAREWDLPLVESTGAIDFGGTLTRRSLQLRDPLSGKLVDAGTIQVNGIAGTEDGFQVAVSTGTCCENLRAGIATSIDSYRYGVDSHNGYADTVYSSKNDLLIESFASCDCATFFRAQKMVHNSYGWTTDGKTKLYSLVFGAGTATPKQVLDFDPGYAIETLPCRCS